MLIDRVDLRHDAAGGIFDVVRMLFVASAED